MPNTRRRRFLVKNDNITERGKQKVHNGSQNTTHQSSTYTKKENSKQIQNSNPTLTTVPTTENLPNDSSSSVFEVLSETESLSSVLTIKMLESTFVDKEVTASSSTIDLFNIFTTINDLPIEQSSNELETGEKNKIKWEARQRTKERTPRRDKYPRQHRVKVRSPRRKVMPCNDICLNANTRVCSKKSHVSTSTVILLPEATATSDERNEEEIVVSPRNVDVRISNHSVDDMCRICHSGESLSVELGQLISACSCRGTVGRVHVKCLERWLTESGKSRCELCGTRYSTRRVHKYGVPRALAMWMLSQNAKQLMVDSLGIMLMSPLAVLAAWLSGRTLAGLMMQDTQVTPWPLASTFVLACMTLVCYYCWIVSAATRHALGWWIWYRAQYEVRLQLESEE